jgi:outer membrane protein assembly factor BamB
VGGSVRSSPAVANGVVFVGSDAGTINAFDAKTCGSAICPPIWTAVTGGGVASSPAVSNGRLYVGSSDAKLHVYALGD